MRFSLRASIVWTAAIFLSAVAHADVVAIFDGSTTPLATAASGGDLSVDVGVISGEVLLRIYDEVTIAGASATLSVGKVTLTGSVAASGPNVLKILVANRSDQPSFPGVPTDPMRPGLVNFGAASGGLVIANTALRDVTTLAIAVSGNLTGSIDVGRVYRVQALGVTNTTTGLVEGGTIASNITAHVGDDQPGGVNPTLGGFSVNVVTAGKGISGNITAEHTASLADHLATVGRVLVGTGADSTGLQGNVLATGGIEAVFSTGPIGSATRTVSIHAGASIGEIRAVDPMDTSLVGTQNMFVDLSAGHNFAGGVPDGVDPVNVFRTLDPTLGRIATNGTLSGTIRAYQVCEQVLAVPSDPRAVGAQSGTVPQPLGVFANTLNADVSVKGSMTGLIVAHKISGSIRIGWMLDGSIIATDVDDSTSPTIPLVEIGYGDSNTLPADIRRGNGVGFIGGENLLVDGPIGLARSVRDPIQVGRFFAEVGTNDDVMAGLIAARSIGSLRISKMTAWEIDQDASPEAEQHPPVVEVQQIGSLEIGDLRQGIVWSGNFDDAPSTPVEFRDTSHTSMPSDHFTKDDYVAFPGGTGGTPQIRIGCMGNGADLWVKSFNTLQVAHSVLGEIHCPTLPAQSKIAIGDALGSESDAAFSTCGCHEADIDGACTDIAGVHFTQTIPDSIWSPRYLGNSLSDPSPRTQHGRIWVNTYQGLNGQIILNANNSVGSDPADLVQFWKGEVIVGPAAYGNADPSAVITSSCTVLSPDATDADHHAPWYALPSSQIGGGAVVVAPFHLYDTDCFPANNTLTPAPLGQPKTTVVSTDFEAGGTNDAHPVNIRFYGPIYKSGGTWNSKVQVHCMPLSQAANICTFTNWQNVTGLTLVRGPGDDGWTDRRALGISRANSLTMVGPGIYRVTFVNVLCNDLLSTTNPHPRVITDDVCPTDAYYFRVGRDCPMVGSTTGDGIDDSVQTGQFSCPTGCGDFNHSGGIEVQDIFDFLQAWFYPCTGQVDSHCLYGGTYVTADFNHDHTLSVQDIFDFLASWFAGTGCQP